MKNILDIYQEYKIIPQLQLHQLRVAAVAKQICDNLTVPVDPESVIKACLLHDMGNILKFQLDKYPEFIEPGTLEYWQKVQQEFAEKYRTTDEHKATLQIAEEIGVTPEALACIDTIGFEYAPQNAASGTMEQKVCDYSDMRVAPQGVVSLEGRLADGRKRYQGRKRFALLAEKYDHIVNSLSKIEDQIFEQAKIKPSDITDESAVPIIEELRTYEI